MIKYAFDFCPQGPKGLGPRNIAPGLGLGFTRVLPWGPENRPQAWALGWPGPGWPIMVRACIGSIENRLGMGLNEIPPT